MRDENYIKSLRTNKEIAKEYYTKSLNKTHQQIFLEEEILPKILPEGFKPSIIADIACGGGTLTYHISKIFPQAKFILVDLNPDAIELARKINKGIKNITYLVEDFYKTSISANSCDLVFSMQTLLTVKSPKKFLNKIIEITKKGGYFILSSLFNIDHDVDIFCSVKDYTRKGNYKLVYNTFSKRTIQKWLYRKVDFFDIKPFYMPVDLEKSGKGLGSYTILTQDGKRITVSGGMLLNWGFLYGRK